MFVHILHIPSSNMKNTVHNKYCPNCDSDSRQTIQLTWFSKHWSFSCDLRRNLAACTLIYCTSETYMWQMTLI